VRREVLLMELTILGEAALIDFLRERTTS